MENSIIIIDKKYFDGYLLFIWNDYTVGANNPSTRNAYIIK